MNISAKLGMAIAAFFTIFCLGFALTGFTSLDGITDPVQLRDARGYSWFWTFLAAVGVVFGVLSWWIGRTSDDR